MSIFKRRGSLEVVGQDPKVDPKPVVKPSDQTPWLTHAKKYLGIKEVPGAKDNPEIVRFHSFTTLKATDDEVAWCSSWMCCVIEESGYGPSTKSAAARSWLGYGKTIREPTIGAIAILYRGSNNWQGHVGIIVEKKVGQIKLLGGNQGNAVSEQWFSTARVLGYRWPEKK